MGKIIGEGITFDDVLLVPQYSEVTPDAVDISTSVIKNEVFTRVGWLMSWLISSILSSEHPVGNTNVPKPVHT